MDEYFRNRAEVDDPDLLQDRRKNDARLKSRFEHIFAKYEKDFAGIGDEIDLESGEIVVDNGHLTNMRHEVDPGKSTSSGLVQAFAAGEGLEIESTENTDDDDEEEEDDIVITGVSRRAEPEEDAGEISSEEYSNSGVITDGEDDAKPKPSPFEPDELSSDFYPENADLTTKKRKRCPPTTPAEASSREVLDGILTAESSKTTSRNTSPEDMLENVPFLAESMRAMHTTREGVPMDEGAIQALGQSIANQLAQYMTQAPHRKAARPQRRSNGRDSPWDYPALPRDKRQRTPTPPREPMSSSAALFAMSPGDGGSIWAPAQHPKQRKLKKPRTKLMQQTLVDTTTDNDGDIDPLQSDSPQPLPRNIIDTQLPVEIQDTDDQPLRECENCGETNTPNFRKGPDGEDLCNACGMYFYRYGLLKPPYDPNPAPSPPRPEPAHGTFSVLIPTNHGILPGDEYDIPVTPEAGDTVGYPANTARRVVANGVRMTRFTVEEDEKIIKLREIDDYPWETIGRIVSGRSAYAVQCRYSKCLRGKNIEARRRLLEHGVPVKQPEEESDEKDFVVIDYDEEARGNTLNGLPANSTDPFFNDRHPIPDSHLASSRMAQRSMRTSYHDLHDGQCRVFKRFTDEENATIVRLREVENMAWEQIHRFLPGRTLLSLQKHYRRELYEPPDDLDPALFTQDQRPLKFTKEEDDLIVRMRDVEAMSFAEMTDYLSERSEVALEERYRYVVTRNAAAKRATPRPKPRIKREEEPPAKQLAPFYPDSTPYQQWIPGSSAQPPPGHPYANSTNNIFGRVNLSESPGYASAPSGHLPQTPAVPMPSSQFPPRPMSVGPSAWAATQPASKGPLPFQPARKRPVPILPAPRWPVPVDPFESRPIPKRHVLGPVRDAVPNPRRSSHLQRTDSRTDSPNTAPAVAAEASPSEILPSQLAHSVLQFPSAEPGVSLLIADKGSKHVDVAQSLSEVQIRSNQATGSHRHSPRSAQIPLPSSDVAALAHTDTDAHVYGGTNAEIIEISSDPPKLVEAAQVPTPVPTSANLSKGTTPDVLNFSNEEDRLIKKWREKEGASWSEITGRLPHRTQQEVIGRYYDNIVGNSAIVKAAVAQNKQDPRSKHGRRYTDAESEKVLTMRDLGLSWEEMADQLPGRTSTSVQNHFYGALLSSTKLKRHYAERTPTKGPLPATPLLKQALSNSVRRGDHGQEQNPVEAYAEYSLPPPGASSSREDDIWHKAASVESSQQAVLQTPQTSLYDRAQSADPGVRAKAIHDSGVMMFDSTPVMERQSPSTWSLPYPHGHPPPKARKDHRSAGTSRSKSIAEHDTLTRVVEDSQSAEDLSQSPNDTPEPIMDSVPIPPAEDFVHDTPAVLMRSSPPPNCFQNFAEETPVQPTRYGTPPTEATPYFQGTSLGKDPTSVYETPARFNSQTMPYFVAPAAEAVTPSIEQTNSNSPATKWTRSGLGLQEPNHSPILLSQGVITADVEDQQPRKRSPVKRARKSANASDPVSNKQPFRKPIAPRKSAKGPRPRLERFSSPPSESEDSFNTKLPVRLPASTRTTRRRKLVNGLPPTPPELNPALINIISQALKSRPDMCMYRPEILAWITEHHGDFQIEGKWETVLHFNLSGWKGFTNLYPGKYQPLWTLTDEVDGVDFAGKGTRRQATDTGPEEAGNDELAEAEALPTAHHANTADHETRDVVNLVTSESAATSRSKDQAQDSQAFGSDDNNNILVARPIAGVSLSGCKHRSTNAAVNSVSRPTKKARYSEPMRPLPLRRIKRERTSTPAYGLGRMGRTASVALPSGRRVIFARGGGDGEGEEDELAREAH